MLHFVEKLHQKCARSRLTVCIIMGDVWSAVAQKLQVNHALYPSDTSNTEKKHSQCSVCKAKDKLNDRSILASRSEHSLRKTCHLCASIDTVMKINKEGGDYEPEKEFNPDTDIPRLQIKKTNGITTDLASGDRENKLVAQDYHIISTEINGDVKKSSKKEDKISHKELHLKKSSDLVVEYKNPHFQESKTSVNTNNGAYCFEQNNEDKKEEESDEAENCDKDPRPVVCPVTNCSKIVTIDSFMLHILFDHSKVPRTTLDDTMPQEVRLKSTHFSTEVQCVASFIIESQKRTPQTIKKRMESTISARSSKKESKLLLLLAVRLPTISVKLPSRKCDPVTIFTRSVHTQTDKFTNEHCAVISTECLSKSGSDHKFSKQPVFDDDGVFILWLCKLDETERVFSITLLGEDKRRGYCYIGDAIHVRDKQDPSLLYGRSECLIIKGSAINSLFDVKGQITAIVSQIG